MIRQKQDKWNIFRERYDFGASNKAGTCLWCGRKLRFVDKGHPGNGRGYRGDGVFCGPSCGYRFALQATDEGFRPFINGDLETPIIETPTHDRGTAKPKESSADPDSYQGIGKLLENLFNRIAELENQVTAAGEHAINRALFERRLAALGLTHEEYVELITLGELVDGK